MTDAPQPAPRRRLPPWLRKTLPVSAHSAIVQRVLGGFELATVCHSAKCPNRAECFAEGTATFMILGEVCSRECTFCAVDSGRPQPPRPAEPQTVAEAVARLGLRHAVITSVTRDDLPDGGASHFARTILAVRSRCPQTTVEVLTPDFQGDLRALDCVLDAEPNVFNHNLETVRRLYPMARHQADYDRSLALLAHAAGSQGDHRWTKSGLMVGLGETDDELMGAVADLRRAGCDILTLGQYLRPTDQSLPVARFVEPAQFDAWRAEALAMGFSAVVAGPFVRSSYHAADAIERNGA